MIQCKTLLDVGLVAVAHLLEEERNLLPDICLDKITVNSCVLLGWMTFINVTGWYIADMNITRNLN